MEKSKPRMSQRTGEGDDDLVRGREVASLTAGLGSDVQQRLSARLASWYKDEWSAASVQEAALQRLFGGYDLE